MPTLFDAVSHLLIDPPVHPEQWCDTRPCVDLGGVIWTEPLGTLLVYGLGVFWIITGRHFWRQREDHRSRFWWACAMLLGGFAGLCDMIELDAVTQALRDRFPGKLGDMNTTAATVACEYVQASLAEASSSRPGSVHA